MTSDIVSVEIGRSTWQGPAEDAPRRAARQDDTITMTYRNYRGEVDQRTVLPIYIWFGSTKYHPEPGWLMHAKDLAKGEPRDFALADCQFADLYRSADMAECAAFSAGYEAGERDGRASGQQVRALNRAVGDDRNAGWTLPVGDLSAIKHHVYHEDGEIVSLEAVEIIALEVERILAALTPAPQPDGEAVPKCVACEDSPKHPNIPCAVCGAHTPQPSETVAEALREIRAAIQDGNLSQGIRLDIIDKIALRALKGGA